MKERHQHVNKNEIKFPGKILGNVEDNDIRFKQPLIITKRDDTTPILEVNWVKRLPVTINKLTG